MDHNKYWLLDLEGDGSQPLLRGVELSEAQLPGLEYMRISRGGRSKQVPPERIADRAARALIEGLRIQYACVSGCGVKLGRPGMDQQVYVELSSQQSGTQHVAVLGRPGAVAAKFQEDAKSFQDRLTVVTDAVAFQEVLLMAPQKSPVATSEAMHRHTAIIAMLCAARGKLKGPFDGVRIVIASVFGRVLRELDAPRRGDLVARLRRQIEDADRHDALVEEYFRELFAAEIGYCPWGSGHNLTVVSASEDEPIRRYVLDCLAQDREPVLGQLVQTLREATGSRWPAALEWRTPETFGDLVAMSQMLTLAAEADQAPVVAVSDSPDVTAAIGMSEEFADRELPLALVSSLPKVLGGSDSTPFIPGDFTTEGRIRIIPTEEGIDPEQSWMTLRGFLTAVC